MTTLPTNQFKDMDHNPSINSDPRRRYVPRKLSKPFSSEGTSTSASSCSSSSWEDELHLSGSFQDSLFKQQKQQQQQSPQQAWSPSRRPPKLWSAGLQEKWFTEEESASKSPPLFTTNTTTTSSSIADNKNPQRSEPDLLFSASASLASRPKDGEMSAQQIIPFLPHEEAADDSTSDDSISDDTNSDEESLDEDSDGEELRPHPSLVMINQRPEGEQYSRTTTTLLRHSLLTLTTVLLATSFTFLLALIREKLWG